MIPVKKQVKTRVLYARGITARNYNFLRNLAKKKGYKTIADLLNEIIDQVRKEES